MQALVRKHEEAYLESEEQGDREFWVAFYNKTQTLPLRQLKTGSIGQLTCFRVSGAQRCHARKEVRTSCRLYVDWQSSV